MHEMWDLRRFLTLFQFVASLFLFITDLVKRSNKSSKRMVKCGLLELPELLTDRNCFRISYGNVVRLQGYFAKDPVLIIIAPFNISWLSRVMKNDYSMHPNELETRLWHNMPGTFISTYQGEMLKHM